MEPKQTQPLSMVQTGNRAKLVRIEAGRGLNSRLASVGLIPNVDITVVRNSHHGPFVISVKGSKLMLGRGMAGKIMVNICDYEKDNSSTGRQS